MITIRDFFLKFYWLSLKCKIKNNIMRFANLNNIDNIDSQSDSMQSRQIWPYMSLKRTSYTPAITVKVFLVLRAVLFQENATLFQDILRQKNAAALESHARLAKTSAKKPPAAAAPPRPKSNADLRRSLRSSLGPRASSSPGKLEKATRGPAAKARSVTRTSLKRGRR